MEEKYISVTTLTKYIRRKFDVDPYMQKVWVKGEISNFRPSQRGHLYFTLKDEGARIPVAMFMNQASKLEFQPEEGMKVLVSGSISVYEESGKYQLYIQEMIEDGTGNLFLAFQKLKQKLEKEGLFLEERKKPLPLFPKHIAILTSPHGAAVHDMVSTLKRRYPLAQVTVVATIVQGDGAVPSIIKNLRRVQTEDYFREVDLVIVGRGGGSIEELWAFNEEDVIREIAACKIPIISAVGHETDFTLADFVADLRAPTPTGAAEMATPDLEDLMIRLNQAKVRMKQSIQVKVRNYKTKLEYLSQAYVLKNPKMTYVKKEEKLDSYMERLQMVMPKYIVQKDKQLKDLQSQLQIPSFLEWLARKKLEVTMYEKQLEASLKFHIKQKQNVYVLSLKQLEAYGPLQMMQRGFLISKNEKGKIIRSIQDVEVSEKVELQLYDGQVYCTVVQKNPLSLKKGGKSDV